MTTEHLIQTDYDEFIKQISEAGTKMDAEPETVAQIAIIATEKIDDDEYILRFNGDPYITERVWPSDVFLNSDRYPVVTEGEDVTIRDMAVEILASEIQVYRDAE